MWRKETKRVRIWLNLHIIDDRYDQEIFGICRRLLSFSEDGIPQAREVEDILEGKWNTATLQKIKAAFEPINQIER